MAIRELFAAELSRLLEERGQPLAQTARDLGYTRQRLHQLKTGDRTARPEAIEEAINKLGFVLVGVHFKSGEAVAETAES